MKVRRQIDLESYDFSKAAVKLVASVNGRYAGIDSLRYGQNRIGALVGAKKSEGTLTYQTSSLGKLNSKFLISLLSQCLKKPEVPKSLKIIFPTEGYVQTSHLGQEHASSVILNEDYYRGPDFPR